MIRITPGGGPRAAFAKFQQVVPLGRRSGELSGRPGGWDKNAHVRDKTGHGWDKTDPGSGVERIAKFIMTEVVAPI